jgi:hypothetical protein
LEGKRRHLLNSLELSADAPTVAGEETRTSSSPERAVSRRPCPPFDDTVEGERGRRKQTILTHAGAAGPRAGPETGVRLTANTRTRVNHKPAAELCRPLVWSIFCGVGPPPAVLFLLLLLLSVAEVVW